MKNKPKNLASKNNCLHFCVEKYVLDIFWLFLYSSITFWIIFSGPKTAKVFLNHVEKRKKTQAVYILFTYILLWKIKKTPYNMLCWKEWRVDLQINFNREYFAFCSIFIFGIPKKYSQCAMKKTVNVWSENFFHENKKLET